jgi:hypothetical protein
MADSTIKYIELHSHQGVGHVVTNEDPRVHSALLRRAKVKRVKKAASICSGGEIPLFVLLPRAEEVICVDHSTKALGVAILKCLMLRELGAKKMRDLMISTKRQELPQIAKPFVALMPETLREGFILDEPIRDLEQIARLQGYQSWNQMEIAFGGPQYVQKYKDHGWRQTYHPLSSGDADTQLVWQTSSLKALEIARERLDNLTFVHGDLRDIASMGPFDLFYASNARGHSSRSTSGVMATATFLLDQIETLLAPGGILLDTADIDTIKRRPDRWRMIENILYPDYRTGTPKATAEHYTRVALTAGWNYNLAQRQGPVEVAG